MCIRDRRITEEQAAEYAAQWSAQRGALMGILRNLVVLCLLAVIAYICLLFVTGRTGEDEAVHLVTIDRLFIELNLLLLFGLPIAAGAVSYTHLCTASSAKCTSFR